jgi:hypothetical protein
MLDLERSRSVSYTRLPSRASQSVPPATFALEPKLKKRGPTTGSGTVAQLGENRVIASGRSGRWKIAPGRASVYKPALSKAAAHGHPEYRHHRPC